MSPATAASPAVDCGREDGCGGAATRLLPDYFAVGGGRDGGEGDGAHLSCEWRRSGGQGGSCSVGWFYSLNFD